MSGADDVYGASPVKRERRTNAALDQLDQAIIAAVATEHPVTLRGVFYRVMSAGAVDKSENGYKAVGRRLLKLRRTHRIPHSWITDGTRWVFKPNTHDSIEDALADTARSYRRALWSASDYALQLFSEKDAITGVIEGVTDEYDVALGIVRGYSSESFAWRVAESLDPTRYNVLGQLGDHDPSGVGAWADFTKKVRAFADDDVEISFERLAVTPNQIDGYDLPMRPTKLSDTRSAGWIGGSVEVDAIPAPELRVIVRGWIESYVDARALELARVAEADERAILRQLAIGGIR